MLAVATGVCWLDKDLGIHLEAKSHGCWQKAPIPHLMGPSIVSVLISLHLAFPTPSDLRGKMRRSRSFHNLASTGADPDFCCILFVGSASLSPAHFQGEENEAPLLKGGVLRNLWTYFKMTMVINARDELSLSGARKT